MNIRSLSRYLFAESISIRNNFPVCIVATLLPAHPIDPLYPGASSHDVAKRHSLAVKGVMFNSSSNTMPLKKRDLFLPSSLSFSLSLSPLSPPLSYTHVHVYAFYINYSVVSHSKPPPTLPPHRAVECAPKRAREKNPCVSYTVSTAS